MSIEKHPNDAAVNAKNKVIATYPAVDDTNRYEEALFRYADRIEKGMPYLRNSTTDKFCTDIINDMREEAIKSIRNAQGSLGEAIAEDTKRRVNTESAAKLVSGFIEQMDIVYDDYLKYQNGDLKMDFQSFRIGLASALEEYQKARHLIERHATPQTHGEGEAAVLGPDDDDCFTHGLGACAMYPGCKCGPNLVRVSQRAKFSPETNIPAPSPTAAPALGELAKKLLDHADVLTKVCGDCYTDQEDIDKAIPLMRQAAAALSGVAAQGETTNSHEISSSLVVGAQGDNHV